MAMQAPRSAYSSEHGIVAGLLDGYLVSINPKATRASGEGPAIEIVVRTGGIQAPSLVRSGLEGGFNRGSKVTVDAFSAQILWSYNWLVKPSPEKVGAAVRNVLTVLSPFAQSCTKCHKCGAKETLEIFFLGRHPELWCSRCREQCLHEAAAIEERLAAIPVRFGRALALTSAVSIGGAEIIARALHDSSQISLFFWSTAALGLVVGFIAAIGAGKPSRGVKVLACTSAAFAPWIAFFRATMLSDPAHPVFSWDSRALAMASLFVLWCSWMPLLLAYGGVSLGDLLFRLRFFKREKSRQSGGRLP
ncbi:MAG: hypothetical protein ACRD50_11295 [Candidatus Acidiferrales bacterium]